jgi:hypothetical protein
LDQTINRFLPAASKLFSRSRSSVSPAHGLNFESDPPPDPTLSTMPEERAGENLW